MSEDKWADAHRELGNAVYAAIDAGFTPNDVRDCIESAIEDVADDDAE